jgi:2'-5' RNA ligase
MRYFIGSLLRGEVAEYYKVTCTDLANRFGIANVADIVPPHITIKTSFERPNAEIIDEVLALNTEVKPIPISLSSWNHFGTRTIFMEGQKPDRALIEYTNTLLGKLRASGIPTSPEDREVHIRMSIARFLKPREFQDIWNYLQTVPAPKFDMTFDNVTIFYKENKDDKAWKVLKTFPLITPKAN